MKKIYHSKKIKNLFFISIIVNTLIIPIEDINLKIFKSINISNNNIKSEVSNNSLDLQNNINNNLLDDFPENRRRKNNVFFSKKNDRRKIDRRISNLLV